jgi:hypothetical protein
MKLSFVLMCTLTRKDAREKCEEGGRNAKVARSAVFEGPKRKNKTKGNEETHKPHSARGTRRPKQRCWMTVTGHALAASAGDAEERGSMRPSEERKEE